MWSNIKGPSSTRNREADFPLPATPTPTSISRAPGLDTSTTAIVNHQPLLFAVEITCYLGMAVFSLIIINKAGGLIYQREFQAGLRKLSTNDYLVLAGTFHGLLPGTSTPATSSYSYPNPGASVSGLEYLETDKFRLTCFQTLTGTKFLLFTDPMTGNVETIINKIYDLYADYVMKNPFYQLEMPVRCEAFDRHLAAWLRGRA
ncbi:Sybindin-like protein [Penicillium maclennaniae]|uniref:Sybindin-like protein n=1 Tax=Penicillium maclennaniae TaxID=1343394 RepID=UPI0025413B7D|nr:Sybindin-like protein [Penicillium maclennaniae]KAJ5675265.1 Sybindin-like protein [Penicillium maclennaniae]